MKKVLLFCILIGYSLNVSAQAVHLGLNADLSLIQSNYSNCPKTFALPGENLGLFAELMPSGENPMFCRAEFNWSHCPEIYTHSTVNEYVSISYEEKEAVDYLSLPFMFGYAFAQGRIKVSAGQEISFMVRNKVLVTGTRHEYERGIDLDMGREYINYPKDYNPWSVSVLVGAEYMVSDKVGLRLRFTQRLREGIEDGEYKARKLQAGVCWYF